MQEATTATSNASVSVGKHNNGHLFGKLDSGEKIYYYTLRNDHGIEAKLIPLGATLVSLRVPDRNGDKADVVLGFDNPQQYLTDSPYFGAVVGRYGNRIARGQFRLDDKSYILAMNNGKNHLHGGDTGFDKQVWSVATDLPCDHSTVTFRLVSPDGDEGYPGTLRVQVTYSVSLTENTLTVDYRATVDDKPTIVNLTQHSYFNLAGHNAGSAMDHVLSVSADEFTETDSDMIPTGQFVDVDNTPMNFREPVVIGSRIDADYEPLKFGLGYDHNYVLHEEAVGHNEPAAVLLDPASGRVLTVITDQPGLQLYTANFLDGTIVGKNSARYGHRHAVCLETQHFPDSPNHAHFPSTTLHPGEVFTSQTSFKFSVNKHKGAWNDDDDDDDDDDDTED